MNCLLTLSLPPLHINLNSIVFNCLKIHKTEKKCKSCGNNRVFITQIFPTRDKFLARQQFKVFSIDLCFIIWLRSYNCFVFKEKWMPKVLKVNLFHFKPLSANGNSWVPFLDPIHIASDLDTLSLQPELWENISIVSNYTSRYYQVTPISITIRWV